LLNRTAKKLPECAGIFSFKIRSFFEKSDDLWYNESNGNHSGIQGKERFL